MKKVLFGIALILFALLLHLADIWIPFIGSDYFVLTVGFAGLLIAGTGAFREDK